MKEINEYKLVTNAFIDNIPREVNKSIKEGWQPYRGILKHNEKYHQPMVKYKNNKQNLNN